MLEFPVRERALESRPGPIPRIAAALAQLRGAAILSLAVELPEGRRTSAEIAARLGISEGWILSRTGIRERRIARPDERLSDYAARVGARALEQARVRADGAAITASHEQRLIRMDGPEVFRNAVRRMSEVTVEAVSRAGLTLGDIDLFVCHQANARITRALEERLQLPPGRVVDCIETLGNASAATLPLALAAAERDGRLRPGARVLLSAFGAGFTWGAGVIEWGGAPHG